MNYKLFLAGVLLVLPIVASAANPSVLTFTPSVTSMNSGQVASFSWTVNGGGVSFSIPCSQGIKIKKTDGSVLTCDAPYSYSTVDGIDLIVWNLSGGTKSFTARITPKDATGVDISSAKQEVSLSVATIQQPIELMTGTTTIASNDPYTLSWSSSFLDGVNLTISCSPTIRTTSPSYAGVYLPCNTPIFGSDLAGSGSLSLVFNNSAPSASDITLSLLPSMAPGVYNGAGIKTLTVTVDTNAPLDPVTSSFVASSTSERVPTDTPVTLSWVTEKSSGANFRISCNDNIITTITSNGASSTPRCSALAFDTALPISGSATISFTNKDYTNEPITITLTPGRKTGGFDATRGKDIAFLVLPPNISTATAIAQQTAIQTITPSKTNASAPKTLFTRYLIRGSSNAEVRTLQGFLAKDKTLYPEGTVSGYFGPATERAVQRFQEKYNLAKKGIPGYGTVGPKTRSFLNSLN